MRRRGLVALVAIVAVVPAAAARPTRRDRPDADAASEAKSALWGELAHPGTAAAHEQLDDAIRMMRLRTGDLVGAIGLLDHVTRTLPDDADGWGYLAVAALNLRRWPLCASAYAAAWRLDPTWRPARLLESRPTRLEGLPRALPIAIAFCQGRGGELAGAAATLASAIARGESSSELWLRTGEVAMAQGRLDDAIAAFTRAGAEGSARWLLAVANDRARRDDAAEAAAEIAQRYDPSAGAAGWSTVPTLEAGDPDYLLGFAELRAGRPELAIAYFRRYLVAAPAGSPWRARARAHLDVLATVDLVDRVTIEGDGVTDAERVAILAAVRRAQPAFVACMTPVPTRVDEVVIGVASVIALKPMPWTRPGTRAVAPRSPARSTTTVAVGQRPQPLRAGDDLDAAALAVTCLEQAAAKVHLPPAAAGAWKVIIPAVAR